MSKSFLKKVEIRAKDEEIKVYIEDIYANDKQFQHFVDSVLNLIDKFALKFKLNKDSMLDILIKCLKRDI